ncbi:hypothetical protein [uncultured Hyphomicrobium sp.]|uniref:hypothetical protein n=1 Tax=uncultured Hyphomicrobium sp. TaxID=194373 RepID=UPI0025FE2FA3|nr:hypothetical protein [uncultured Hyphomicrobium sp.]
MTGISAQTKGALQEAQANTSELLHTIANLPLSGADRFGIALVVAAHALGGAAGLLNLMMRDRGQSLNCVEAVEVVTKKVLEIARKDADQQINAIIEQMWSEKGGTSN